MLFSIHCMDRAGQLQARLDNYDVHRAHLNNTTTVIVLAGPITADDGETPIGSVFVIDAADREEAEAFNRTDPFFNLGVWARDSIHIHPLIKRRGWLAGY
jgi:uncharacterized protein YciI